MNLWHKIKISAKRCEKYHSSVTFYRMLFLVQVLYHKKFITLTKWHLPARSVLPILLPGHEVAPF